MTISKKISVTFTNKDIELIEKTRSLCDEIFYGLGDGNSLMDLGVVIEHDTESEYNRYSEKEILAELEELYHKLNSILYGI